MIYKLREPRQNLPTIRLVRQAKTQKSSGYPKWDEREPLPYLVAVQAGRSLLVTQVLL